MKPENHKMGHLTLATWILKILNHYMQVLNRMLLNKYRWLLTESISCFITWVYISVVFTSASPAAPPVNPGTGQIYGRLRPGNPFPDGLLDYLFPVYTALHPAT
jgi:hypothetical protein